MNNIYKYRSIILSFSVALVIILSIAIRSTAKAVSDTSSSITRVYRHIQAVPVLLRGSEFSFEFTATENNLGIIGIPIANHNRSNTEILTFRIKEAGNHNWFYTNPYNTKGITSSRYYPFGFPRQSGSKGKKYLVQLIPTQGRKGDAVGIALDHSIYVKYVFMKNEIKQGIIGFVASKITAYVLFVDVITYGVIFVSGGILIGLFIFKRKWFNHLLPYFDPTKHIALLKKYVWQLNNDSSHRQLLLIVLFFVCFFDSALVSGFTSKSAIPMLSWVVIVILHVTLIYLVMRTDIRHWIKHIKIPNIFFFAVFFFLLIIRLQFVNDLPRWDGGNNLQSFIGSLRSFNFTFGQFFSDFRLWGHSSHGFGILLAILSFVNPTNLLTLQISFLLLHILLYWSLFLLFRDFLRLNTVPAVLLSAMIVFAPIVFASSIIFSLDYPVLVFFVAFLAFFTRKEYLLAIFFGFLTVFSKEIGILVYASFIGSYILYHPISSFFLKKQKISPGLILDFVYKSLFFCLPVFLFFIYILINKGRLWGGEIETVGTSFFFDRSIAYQRFGQMFVLNWSWLLCLFIGMLMLCSKDRLLAILNHPVPFAIFMTDLAYVIFNLMFVTATHPRYIVIQTFFLVFFAAVYFKRNTKLHRLFIPIMAMLVMLNIVQTVKTVDPVSQKYFGTMRFGNHTMLKISDDFSSRCDSMIYNTEFTHITRLFNNMNKSIHIKPADSLIFSTLDDTSNRNPWLTYYEQAYVDNHLLELTYDDSHSFKPRVYYVDALPSNFRPNKDGNLYYVYLPWLSKKNIDSQLPFIKQSFKISSEQEIEINGYYLRIYKLETI